MSYFHCIFSIYYLEMSKKLNNYYVSLITWWYILRGSEILLYIHPMFIFNILIVTEDSKLLGTSAEKVSKDEKGKTI